MTTRLAQAVGVVSNINDRRRHVMNTRQEQVAMELVEFAERLRHRPKRRRVLHLRATRGALGKGLQALALVSLMRKVGLRRTGRIAALVIGAHAERPGRRRHRFD
jgi:hypothetical protein